MSSIEYHRLWKKNNPEKVRQYRKEWKKRHPDKLREHKRNKYRRDHNLPESKYRLDRIGEFRSRDGKRAPWYKRALEDLSEIHGFICRGCGVSKDLTINHIIPVAVTKKRYVSNLSELEILCKPCNIREYQEIVKRALTHYYSCYLISESLSVSTSQEEVSEVR